jgi:hypothetical protein
MSKVSVKGLYSIVRFLPFLETGEFANVGIVLVAPSRNYFDFKLTKKVSRISAFFDPIAINYVRESIKNAKEELLRVRRLSGRGDYSQHRLNFGESEPAEIFFKELTRRREGVVRYSESRALLLSDPRRELDELFEHYVNRGFVHRVYPEVVLEKRVRSWLRTAQLDRTYVEKKFDDGLYQASFPFVKLEAGKATRVIKPFYLGHEDTTAILDRGIKWSATVSRLKGAGQLPSDILFAVEGPDQPNAKVRKAYSETIGMLESEGVKVLPLERQSDIIQYAMK